MHSISRLSVAKLFLLFFVLVGGGLFAHSCTLTARACRDNIVCMIREQGEKIGDAGNSVAQISVYGYKCVDLICRSGCSSDADCDAEQGYKCDTTTKKSGLCRCDVTDLKKPCHQQCFRNEECHARVDPNTKKPLFPLELGWICTPNATNSNLPGKCECPEGAKCKGEAGGAEEPAEEESAEEEPAEEASTPDGGNTD